MCIHAETVNGSKGLPQRRVVDCPDWVCLSGQGSRRLLLYYPSCRAEEDKILWVSEKQDATAIFFPRTERKAQLTHRNSGTLALSQEIGKEQRNYGEIHARASMQPDRRETNCRVRWFWWCATFNEQMNVLYFVTPLTVAQALGKNKTLQEGSVVDDALCAERVKSRKRVVLHFVVFVWPCTASWT